MNAILVAGATGNVGRTVVAALQARGTPVRAFVRDEDAARRLLGPGTELALGDFRDPASLARALRGVDAVFLTSADGPEKVAHETAVIDAAVAASVGRIVKLSSPHVLIGSDLVFWDWHGRIEQHLLASGVPAVCLRAGFLMSNLLSAADMISATGRIAAPAGDARIAMIDPLDVGACAAVTLTRDGHAGRTYRLTGPQAVSYHDVAAALSAATGRSVRFVDVSDEDARAGLSASGAPDWLAAALVTMFAKLRNGAGEETTDTVRSLTGRRPRTVAEWLVDRARAFAVG
ncbi:SDR family oxidoreductase [Streptomyces tendae]|uniref:SDR family oxidoreductase n=1 Tax=Streptomyces tendae TaxID=1932 RepID=UPI0033BBD710